MTFTASTIGELPLQAPGGSPFGRRFAAAELRPATGRQLAASMAGGLTLIDVENDGRLERFVAAPSGFHPAVSVIDARLAGV